MRRVLTAMALTAAGMTASTGASAQSWGVYVGNDDGGYYRTVRHGDGGYRLMRSICSGARAHALEARLRHEEDEGEIDGDDARRIHAAIDRLEDRQRDECAEGDWRSIQAIVGNYNQIDRWIDAEAHGERPDDW